MGRSLQYTRPTFRIATRKRRQIIWRWGTVPDAPAVPAEPDGRALGPDSAPTPGVIYWGDATNVTGDADISTKGDLVIAVNAASKRVTSNPTVNGVKFTSTGATLGWDAGADAFDRNTVDDPEMISAGYDLSLIHI